MITSIILMVFIGLLIKHLFFWSPVSGSHIYKHPHPLFIAHRGLHKTEPENTMPSIKKAKPSQRKAPTRFSDITDSKAKKPAITPLAVRVCIR